MPYRKKLNTETEINKEPVIVLTGGGSGGHITPILAVASELKKLSPNSQLIYIGQKNDKINNLPLKEHGIEKSFRISAGKFRRFHGLGPKQALDLATLFKNLHDLGRFVAGFFQSYRLLGKIQPNVVFVKGGFVGVPVGLAAALRRVPYVTHDSDALPGLANRIISPWAAAHAVALPKDAYKYPSSKTYTVGVPISSNFRRVGKDQKNKFKRMLGLEPTDQLLFVTGGGLGAKRLNEAVVQASATWLSTNPRLNIIHSTGPDHEANVKNSYNQLLADKTLLNRVKVRGFFADDMYINSGGADLIICRGGATSLAEFAAQQKACVVVPNPQLTGGHQLVNARYLTKKKAVSVVDDDSLSKQSELLTNEVQRLLEDSDSRTKLAKALGSFARPRAAKELAELIIEEAN